MSVDPRFVQTWLKGWAITRGTCAPTAVEGGWRIDVGWPEQKARIVFPAPCDALSHAAATIQDPWIFLKVCALPEAIRPALPPQWTIQPLSFFMGCDRPMAAGADLPGGYGAETTESAVGAEVRVTSREGKVAASGHLALPESAAVYDRIETHADHRRRGLGAAVMRLLEQSARQRGHDHGLLVATADGRALYERLGWRVLSPYTSAVIQG